MHTLPKVRRSLLDPSSLNFSLFSEPLGTDSLHRTGVSLEQSFHSSHPGLWLSLFCPQTAPVWIPALLDCEVLLWKAIFLRIVSLFFSPSLCMSLCLVCGPLLPELWEDVMGCVTSCTQGIASRSHSTWQSPATGQVLHTVCCPFRCRRWKSHRKMA